MAFYESMQLEEEACQNCFTNIVKTGKICRPKGFVLKNTEKTVNWMVQVFKQQKEERNKATSDDREMSSSSSALSRCHSITIVEARKEDGKLYLPSSISNLLAGLYDSCNQLQLTS